MAELDFMVEPSNIATRGTLELGSCTVPYLDLRAESEEALRRFVAEITSTAPPAPGQVRGLIITTPHTPDALGLKLARSGIRVIAGTAPLAALLNRFREQLRVIGNTGSSPATAASVSSGSGSSPGARPRSESPFTQRPPWFDAAAWDQRLRQLQQPWRDEDAWQSQP